MKQPDMIVTFKQLIAFRDQGGGSTALVEEIKCYSLPYGGLGFASHFLTYYAIICLWFGHSPLAPWRRVKYTKLDFFLGFSGLAITVGLSIYTIIKCKNTWQLLVIAVWKMTMSLLNGITAVHVAINMWMYDFVPGQRPPKTGKTAWWLVIYVPGMFAGMCGLMSLVVKHMDPGVRKLTISFYCIVGMGVLIILAGVIREKCMTRTKVKDEVDDAPTLLLWSVGGIALSFILFSVLAAFYSDWALGMMTNNLLGLPTSDNAPLYWSYFVAKRLTLFSW